MDESIPRIHTPLRILPFVDRDRRRPARRGGAREEPHEDGAAERGDDASFGHATPTEPGVRIDVTA